MTGVTQLRRGTPLLPDFALVGITLIWATTFVMVKDALASADPSTFLTLRFTLAAFVAALMARQTLRDAAAWRGGAVLGLLLFGGYYLQTMGLEFTTPGRSAFITGLCVVFVPFCSWLLFRRRPQVASLVGVSLAVVGLALLTGFDPRAPWPPGDALTLGCAVAYAFHITLTGKYARTTAPTALVTVQLLVTAGLSALTLPFGPIRLVPTVGLLGAVVFTGVFATAIAVSIQAWAQARSTPIRAALIFAIEPVFAAGLSAFLGRESFSLRDGVAGSLIVAGVLVSELGPVLLAGRSAEGK